MRNLNSFREFTSPLLEKLNISSLIEDYDITDSEWEAMRIIPEKGIPKDLEEYYGSKGAKDFLNKIISLVCEGVFGDDPQIKTFMSNVAAVESCYGTNPSTYKRPNQTKGIFQLDRNTALKTIGYSGNPPVGNHKVKSYIAECKKKIKNKLGLDWDKLPYESLSKPLYNALAARIFIGLKERSYTYDKKTNNTEEFLHPIPEEKKEQAKWWKDRYNTTSGAGTSSKFINPPGCNL